jgi:two-component system response regulator (stage 0 sporulation protein F)
MKTILATDGNENIRLLLETELSLEGYRIILAGTGLETLKKIRGETPDLVILDLRMPDMYDLELLKTIREENKKLPIILSTVYKQVRDNPTIGASGVAGYFIKPFGVNRLKATIKRSLVNQGA